MKKTYQTPNTTIVRTNMTSIICTSETQTMSIDGEATSETTVDVKSNNNYNVWDDDWSW